MAVVGDKNQMIGDINNEDWLKDEDVLMKFLKKDDFLDNPICNDCKFFPVCNENCILSNEELSVRCRATAKIVDNYMNNMCKEIIDG
jgi:radical SAM protein with 4Fe4S-binding SPASM domain